MGSLQMGQGCGLRVVTSLFTCAAGGWWLRCLFPCMVPILAFLLFILIQREKAQQEGETGVLRSAVKNEANEPRAMITPALREALTKQGESP